MSNASAGEALLRLMEIMAVLRSPGGCPWDAAQTPDTLKSYLIEETYEVLEALDAGDPSAIRDELGDLLLQIVFHARIFEERRQFAMADVATAITEKLVRRHPHVFGSSTAASLDDLDAQWERIKAEEKKTSSPDRSPFDAIPPSLPSLMRARKVLEKATRAGLPRHPPLETLARVRGLLASLEEHIRREEGPVAGSVLGQLLFHLAELGISLQVDAEDALRRAIEGFRNSVSAAIALTPKRDTEGGS